MRLPHVLLAALSLLAFAGAVQARNAELINPSPVTVPAGLSVEQVAKDIKRALIAPGWGITAEQPGQIDSTLHLREHVASIKLTYDASSVHLGYVDSSNLDYAEKRGKRYTATTWAGSASW